MARGRRKRNETPKEVKPVDTTPEVVEEQPSISVKDLTEDNFEDFKPDISTFFNQKPAKDEYADDDFDEIIEEVKEEIKQPIRTEPKQDINTFFDQNKEQQKELKIENKKKEPKVKKKSKRKQRKEQDYEAIKDRRMFKYKGKKYSKVEDFIKYINEHYLDIETIANDILDDENFLGWVSKKSPNFNESIKEFKKIKQEIEK